MDIRHAKESELALIREQRIEAYSQYTEAIPADHWKALKKTLTAGSEIQSGVDLIVAEHEGEIAGSVVLFPAKTDAYEGMVDELDYPEIRMLAVGTNYRGKGIASALVMECIERAKEKGYNSIGLHTGDFMKGAIHLYEGFGFERLPQFDFEPADDGIIVRAYVLNL